MQRRKMWIKDVDNLTGATLTVDVYDQDTHTTQTITISNIANILTNIIARKYNYRYFYYTGSQPNITPTTAFLGLWNEYKSFKQESINSVFNALVYSKYNPTENVFESRTTINEYGDQTNTTDIGKIKSETVNGARTLTSTNFETSFENATTNGFAPTSKGVNDSASATDSTTNEQIVDGTNKLTRDDDKTTETRHGNVGTIDSMSLILKEADGRHLSFANWVVDDFIMEYTYYSSYGDDLEYEEDDNTPSGGGSQGGTVDDSRITTLETNVNSLTSRVSTLESNVENIDLSGYDEQLEQIDDDITDLQTRVTTLESSSGGGGSVDTEELNVLGERVTTLEGTVAELETTTDTLILDTLSLESRVDALESSSGGGGSGMSVKTFTYTGTGVEAQTVITFPTKPTYIFEMCCTVMSGARVKHLGFRYVQNVELQGVMFYDRGGQGVQHGNYSFSGNDLTITGFSDVGARMNQNGIVTTIVYI